MIFRSLRLRAPVLAAALVPAALSLSLWAPAKIAPAQQVQFQIQTAQPPPDEDPYGVYLPTDRTLARGVTRARARLEAGEYNEALAFLQQLLDRDEDVFVDDGSQSKQLSGLKAAARKLIADLPTAGREMYALLHTAAARRALNAALASGDPDELAQLVRRYFLTAPGYEAAIILAQTELDRGHPLAAAHLYNELLADPTVAAEYEPQLSLLAAVSWRAAGRTDSAAALLLSLAEKFGGTQVEIAGRKIPFPPRHESAAELLAWLDDSVGQAQAVENSSSDWLTLRGDSARNTKHRGGAPHLSPRWESRMVNDPRFENFLTSRREQAEQQGLVAIAAARPIATGNFVLMRTPQNVVALDWQTGKRIWETREEESSAREQYLSDFTSDNNSDEFAALSHPLEQRVWDDTLTMSLSSDGQHVFALSGISLADRNDQSAWNVGPGFGGSFDFTAAPTNRLSAYELATEGKLAWEIDGANASGDLSGIFFLGAPVAVDGSLYVLAEIRSAIYVLALEPDTGKPLWRQQLVGLEQGITLDPQRRLNAATPSCSAGILVCPTTAGIVVAVDVIRREFAWVYRYPRQVESFTNIRPGWQGRSEVPLPRANNRWLDGPAIIADGKVLITPPESADLHCLDLATGTLEWKKPREKSLFLACVDNGNIILVGPESVTALRLSDGAPAWTKDLTLPSESLPAGLGYLSESHYFLPLTSGQVIALNTSDGTTAAAIDAPSDVAVGNLICHRGSIISQSAMFLDKFEQIEVLRERAKSALAVNPRDAAAIRDLAEMRRLEGALPESVTMLKQAYEIDPSDLLTRDMLADTLLEALAGDYAAYRADLPLLRKIIDRPQQQIDLLRIDAQGLDAAGEHLKAFAAYLQLIDATAADLALLSINPDHSARSDNWIRAQLTSLWNSASASDQAEIARELDARKRAWANPPTANELRSYLAYFGGLPDADNLRVQLVQTLFERSDPLDVELEMLRLERSPSVQAQAASAILFTQWLVSEGRLAEAAKLAETVKHGWSDAQAVAGKSPAEWLDAWQPELSTAESVSWPRGRVTVEDLPATAANRPTMTRRAQAEFQLGLRRLRLEQAGGPTLGPSQWLIAQDGSRLYGRNAEGKEVFRYNASRRSSTQRFTGNADLVQAAQLGDFLYATIGGHVVAIDSRGRREGDNSQVLWQSNQSSPYPANLQRTSRRNGQAIYHAWSQRRRVPGAAGRLVASLGPATPDGVVFQDQQRLRCVDPLSGDTLWTRSDVPQGCELFGDEEFLLAADPEVKLLHVLRMSDGQLVERRAIPDMPWLLTSGRNVAYVTDTKDGGRTQKTLHIVNAATGKQLFEADYDPAVRMTTLDPNLVAAIEPNGEFQLVDVRTGELLIDEKLEISEAPRNISMFRTDDQLFLGVGSPTRQQTSRPIGLDIPLVDGEVFAFDLRDGRMIWPGPAVIESRGLALTQPANIPVLVLVDRLLKRDANGSGTKLRLLCLDRATGATIYRNDELPDTSGGHFLMRTTRGETASVDIEMTAKTIRLKFTDLPRSPEPPANDLVEAPRKSLGRGLWGVTRRMSNALQDALKPGGSIPGSDDANAAGDDAQGPIDDD